MSDIVTCEKDAGVAKITLDDGKVNVLSSALLAQLDAAIDEAEGASAAILIVGRPGRFSAGYDLTVMQEGPTAAIEMMSRGADVMVRLLAYPRPVVIACTGHALAGGAVFLCTGDRRIGAEGDFKIGLTEVGIGLPLPGLAVELARARLSKRSFVEATLEARIYDPQAALDAGWLEAVVSPDDLLATASADAARLATLPADAYRQSKETSRKVLLEMIRTSLGDEMAAIKAALNA